MKNQTIRHMLFVIGISLVWLCSSQAEASCTVGKRKLPNGAHWCSGSTLMYCAGGKAKTRAQCAYGCYRRGVLAYCKCKGGLVAGKYFCEGRVRYYCHRSREAGGYVARRSCGKDTYCRDGKCVAGVPPNNPKCEYKGTTYPEGARWCEGKTIFQCLKSRPYKIADCQHGCYNSSPDKAYCSCAGGHKIGQWSCAGNVRQVCANSQKPEGVWRALPCPTGQVCRGKGLCVKLACTMGGTTYRAGAAWCSGKSLYKCVQGQAIKIVDCQFGCHAMGSTHAFCRCKGGANPGQTFCLNGIRQKCSGTHKVFGGWQTLPCPAGQACVGGGVCRSRR